MAFATQLNKRKQRTIRSNDGGVIHLRTKRTRKAAFITQTMQGAFSAASRCLPQHRSHAQSDPSVSITACFEVSPARTPPRFSGRRDLTTLDHRPMVLVYDGQVRRRAPFQTTTRQGINSLGYHLQATRRIFEPAGGRANHQPLHSSNLYQ